MTSGAVNVNVSTEDGRLMLHATGSITAPLTGVYETLGLTESSVLSAINSIAEDDSDDDGEKCKKFEFKNMKKTLTPIAKSEKVVAVERTPVVTTTRSYDNISSEPASHEARLSTNVTNSISSSWCCSQHKDTAFEIGYSAVLTGSARMSFGNTLGESKEVTQALTITAEDVVKVDVKPGQSRNVTLEVCRSDVTLSVKYRVEYSGEVVADKPSCYITYDIKDILKKCKRKTSDKVTETIRLKIFTDSKVVVSD